MQRIKPLLIILIICSLGSCGSENRNTSNDSDAAGTLKLKTLKLAFLPIIDTLPFYIAKENGYFQNEGIEVIAIPVSSPIERDQLMQSGEIEGMINELSSTALFNRKKVQIQTVMIVRSASHNSPVFRILASPGSGITKPADLAGIPIGVSKNSIIEYLTDRILEKEGVDPDTITVSSVPVIPERFQLLLKGELKAATLPDPLAQAAIEAGAVLVIDDSNYPEYSCSVFSFSLETISKNGESIRRFLRGWNKAVKELNTNPESYRDLFLEKVMVPESVKQIYRIPQFPEPGIPDKEQWQDVINWLKEKEILDTDPLYEDSVIKKFL